MTRTYEKTEMVLGLLCSRISLGLAGCGFVSVRFQASRLFGRSSTRIPRLLGIPRLLRIPTKDSEATKFQGSWFWHPD